MLRIAKASDAGPIAAIYRPYVETTAISFEEAPPSAEEIEAKIARVGSIFPFIVFEEGGEVLGYAYATRYRDRAAYRWSLEDSVYVRGDSVGRGIGRALLGALVGLLRELGYVKIYAVITPPNPPSVRLHESFGFESLGRFADTAFLEKNICQAFFGHQRVWVFRSKYPRLNRQHLPMQFLALGQAAFIGEDARKVGHNDGRVPMFEP